MGLVEGDDGGQDTRRSEAIAGVWPGGARRTPGRRDHLDFAKRLGTGLRLYQRRMAWPLPRYFVPPLLSGINGPYIRLPKL